MISLARYVALLEPRDLRQTIAASMIGRLPIGVTGLAILLLVQSASGSFALGGAATAAYVIGLAALAPVLGRLIDRRGPRPTLMTCALAFPAALILLLVAVFPANLHMAMSPEQFPSISPLALWLRLPLQGVLIAWAYWYTRPEAS